MSSIIGIDLGTTNTCVSILEEGQPRILENTEGSRTTPSMVAFTHTGNRLVGQAAKRQMVTNPENTLLAIKRIMGRRHDAPATQDYQTRVAFDLVESSNGDAWVKAGDKEMSPAEVSGVVLQKMKQTAEQFLGEDVTQAVITVPAYFNDIQRQATRDAGRIAGLEVLRIVNEPTAAALAFGLEKTEGKTIAVYDLGGGTFDISILEVNNGVFQVKATSGDTYLGGMDFDQCLMAHIVEKFAQAQGIDLTENRVAMQRVREAAEQARIELSSVQQVEISLPFIHTDEEGPRHLRHLLTRTQLEALVDPLIQRTLVPCRMALKDAGFAADTEGLAGVDEVVLVGGMTRMPKVQQTVAELFGKEPHRGVNPDEVVAMGAAIQGGVLTGEINDILLLDVTPFSLGIRTKGGGFSSLIAKNSAIPCKVTRTFTTAQHLQTQVTVRVAQGEEALFDENRFLGAFELEGLPLALKGTPKIDVTFFVDVDGMVQVAARDQDNGQEQSMRVNISGGLAEEEIQRLTAETLAQAEAEAQAMTVLNHNNKATSLMERAHQLIAEHGKTLGEERVEQMQTSLTNLRSAVRAEDASVQTLMTQIEALQGCYDEGRQAVSEQDALVEATPTQETEQGEDGAKNLAQDADTDTDEGEETHKAEAAKSQEIGTVSFDLEDQETGEIKVALRDSTPAEASSDMVEASLDAVEASSDMMVETSSDTVEASSDETSSDTEASLDMVETSSDETSSDTVETSSDAVEVASEATEVSSDACALEGMEADGLLAADNLTEHLAEVSSDAAGRSSDAWDVEEMAEGDLLVANDAMGHRIEPSLSQDEAHAIHAAETTPKDDEPMILTEVDAIHTAKILSQVEKDPRMVMVR